MQITSQQTNPLAKYIASITKFKLLIHKNINNKLTLRSKPLIPSPRGAVLAGSVTSRLSLEDGASCTFSDFTVASTLEQLCKS